MLKKNMWVQSGSIRYNLLVYYTGCFIFFFFCKKHNINMPPGVITKLLFQLKPQKQWDSLTKPVVY